jgi:drug/metabolite transporter (DMT)-like permease
MAVAVAGVAVMVGGGLAPGRLVGNLLALGSAVSIAMVSVLLRRGRQGDMTPAVFWSGLVSAGLAVVALLLAAEGAPRAAFAVSPRDLLLCSIMGSVQLGLGSVCYALGARHLPAAALQLLALLELVFSPLWVWLVVGEVPATATLAGGGLVMVASVLQAVGGRPLMKLRQTA